MGELDWERLAAVFHDALEQPAATRRAWVQEVCGHDPRLEREVVAMLASHGDDHELGIEQRLGGAGRTDAPTEPLIGTRLGSYRIDALIGEGGMGDVYRAERVDGEYRQTVAIKVLRPGYLSAETVRRFRVERQVLARLVHPGIAPIHDAGTTPDGRPYLVLQLVDGIPITDYCDRHGLDLHARLRLFTLVADAVQFAHGRLIVHRDIKPSNILVDSEGAPRLLDFGIAKLLDHRGDDSIAVATRPELRMLTPEHAAPEQLRGAPVGTATDVYGLGVLLYQMVTGRRPLSATGKSSGEMERAILEDAPPSPSTVAPRAFAGKLKGDLDRIILMALRKEPDRRYVSAGQLAEDVGAYLAGLPVRAQRDTLGYRTRKFVRRNRTLVVVGFVLALVLVGFSGMTAVQAGRIGRERDRAERERAAAEDVVTILTGLFERANPTVVPGGDTVRVASLLTEAEKQVEQLGEHPDRQARMWRVLGMMHAARGQYRAAKALLRRSWEQQQRLNGSDDPDAARTYHELARVMVLFDGPAAARPLLDTSFVRLRRVLGETHSDVAAALQDRALAAESPGDRARLLDSVIALRRRSTGIDSMSVASQLNATGTEAFSRGRLSEALALFEGTLRILESRLPAGHPNRLAVMKNVAAALSHLGEWSRAEAMIREARAHDSTVGLSERGAGSEEQLAIVLANQGRLAESEAGLRRSLTILRASVASDHSRIGNTLRNLGLVLIARGRVEDGLALLDSAIARGPRSKHAYVIGQRVWGLLRLGRIDAAAAALRESEGFLTAQLPEGHGYLKKLPLWHGALAMARGEREQAVGYFETAHRLVRDDLPPDHPEVAQAACALGAALIGRTGALEALPLLQRSCPIHDRWGLGEALITKWGREALQRAGAAPLAGR